LNDRPKNRLSSERRWSANSTSCSKENVRRYRPKLVVDPAFSLLLKLDSGIFNCAAVDLIDPPLSIKIFAALS